MMSAAVACRSSRNCCMTCSWVGAVVLVPAGGSAAHAEAADTRASSVTVLLMCIVDSPFSKFQHDFADERVRCHVLQRRLVVLERKHAVDHGVQLVLGNERA